MENSEQFCLRWNNHQQNLRATMAEQWENQIFTDVTLGVDGGRSIQCHKMILAASSPYFQSIFEKFAHEHHIVLLNNVKYKDIIAILEYMYKGEVNVPGDDLPALFKVAESLEIKGLVGGSKAEPAERAPSPQPEVGSRSFARPEAAEGCENGGATGQLRSSSPPHSTSSPYYLNGKSPASGDYNRAKQLSPPAWPFAQGFPVEGHNPIAAAAALQSSLSARYSSLVGTPYDNGAEAVPRRRRRRKMSNNSIVANRNTPILRTALNQGQVDSSQGIPMLHHLHRQDSHYRSPSNGSANNESDADNKQSCADAFNSSHPIHSPYESETSMVDDDDGKISRRSFSEDPNAGNGNYGPGQKHGAAKRYKQYTHTDIAGAIAAVLESGMSANKAAVLFRVPSRTLYDKISRAKKEEELKNGGAVPPKRRRSAITSGACFPFGIGGNATGSIYGNYSESDNENGSMPIDNPASIMETTFTESRDNSIDRDVKPEIVTKSPSPHLPARSPRLEQTENEAEDLTVGRKSEVHVIMPPSIAIKEAI